MRPKIETVTVDMTNFDFVNPQNNEAACQNCPRRDEKLRFIDKERALGSTLPSTCVELIEVAAEVAVSAPCGLSAWEGVGALVRGNN